MYLWVVDSPGCLLASATTSKNGEVKLNQNQFLKTKMETMNVIIEFDGSRRVTVLARSKNKRIKYSTKQFNI